MPPLRTPVLSGLVWLAALAWGFDRALVHPSEPGAAAAPCEWPSAAPFALFDTRLRHTPVFGCALTQPAEGASP